MLQKPSHFSWARKKWWLAVCLFMSMYFVISVLYFCFDPQQGGMDAEYRDLSNVFSCKPVVGQNISMVSFTYCQGFCFFFLFFLKFCLPSSFSFMFPWVFSKQKWLVSWTVKQASTCDLKLIFTTPQEIKRMLFNNTKQDKRCKFLM